MNHNHHSNITEDLQPLDLEHLVRTVVEVDRHQSKMGEDKDIIVVAFEVREIGAARDLETFLERGYSAVIDADTSPIHNDIAGFSCFVEFERTRHFKKQFLEILDGIKRLTGIKSFSYKYHKSMKSMSLNELFSRIPLTPDDYVSFLENERRIKQELVNLKTIANLPITTEIQNESITHRNLRVI